MRKIFNKLYSLSFEITDFEKSIQDFYLRWENQSHFSFKTSGSTGEPKMIQFSKEEIIESANRTNTFFSTSPEDFALLCLPIDFVGGAMVLIRAIIGNYSVILLDPKENLINDLKSLSSPIHIASFLPNQWHYLSQNKELLEKVFIHAKGVIIGGAGFPDHLIASTKKLDFPVYSSYGMTETISHIALRMISPDYSDYYQVLPKIIIRSNKDQTLKIKLQNTKKWISTNDLVKFKSDKLFKILGRKDFIINSGGLKIDPKNLENILNQILNQNNLSILYFFYPKKDLKYGEVIGLALEINKDKTIENIILEGFKSKLENKYLPKEIIYIEKFQRTWNGKINIPQTLELYVKN